MKGLSRSAFTLVELLIVVSILGILAAIIVPKFQSNASAARDTGATVQLMTVRKTIQLWHAEHGTNYPTLAQMQAGDEDWSGFIGRTDIDGTLNVAGEQGPYLTKPPLNVLTRSSLVADVGGATASHGWTYDESTGLLRLIIPAGANLADFGLNADDVEQLAP